MMSTQTTDTKAERKAAAIAEERARLQAAAIEELPPAELKAAGMLKSLVEQLDRIKRLQGLTNSMPTPFFSYTFINAARAELARIGDTHPAAVGLKPHKTPAEVEREIIVSSIARQEAQIAHYRTILADAERWEVHLTVKHKLEEAEETIKRLRAKAK